MKQKVCLRCDNGKGHKMIEIYSYKVIGNVDEFLRYVCPNCEFMTNGRKRINKIVTREVKS